MALNGRDLLRRHQAADDTTTRRVTKRAIMTSRWHRYNGWDSKTNNKTRDRIGASEKKSTHRQKPSPGYSRIKSELLHAAEKTERRGKFAWYDSSPYVICDRKMATGCNLSCAAKIAHHCVISLGGKAQPDKTSGTMAFGS